MKKLMVLFFVLLNVCCMAAWPNYKQVENPSGANHGYDAASGTWRPIAVDPATGKMAVDAEVSIGSITVEVFPVYADDNGNSATATVDINNRAIVNIGSETIGLVDAVKGTVTEWSQQTLALPANTSTTITSSIAGERVFIEIKSHIPNQTFWVSASNSAVIGDCRPCTEYFYAEIPSGVDVSVIASTAMDLAIVEGGR